MKILRILVSAFINAYKPSADPNLFGSKKRIKSMYKTAEVFTKEAAGTQGDIDKLESENPFESAGAKSAMAKASRTANQMQTRLLNTMGGNASPEALIAAQGNLNEGIGGAAGEIAAGAEQNKNRQSMYLKGLKSSQQGQYGQHANNAASQYGSGWNTLFQGIDSLGGVLEGVGGVKAAFKKG